MPETVALSSQPVASTAIYEYLRKALDVNGRTEIGVFICAIGSLGGFASQQAVWKACIEPGNRNAGEFLAMFRTPSAETFYLGEPINLFLQCVQPGFLSFYSLVAGAVPNPGPATLPDLNEIFAHVARSIGKPEFWKVRLPSQHGLFPSPRVMLDQYWRDVQKLLLLHSAPAAEWPVILGFTAHRVLKASVGSRMPPTLAARLMMEAAIIASKADPRTVPGATSGLNPPAQWSHRALRPETQAEVIAEAKRVLPTRVPR